MFFCYISSLLNVNNTKVESKSFLTQLFQLLMCFFDTDTKFKVLEDVDQLSTATLTTCFGSEFSEDDSITSQESSQSGIHATERVEKVSNDFSLKKQSQSINSWRYIFPPRLYLKYFKPNSFLPEGITAKKTPATSSFLLEEGRTHTGASYNVLIGPSYPLTQICNERFFKSTFKTPLPQQKAAPISSQTIKADSNVDQTLIFADEKSNDTVRCDSSMTGRLNPTHFVETSNSGDIMSEEPQITNQSSVNTSRIIRSSLDHENPSLKIKEFMSFYQHRKNSKVLPSPTEYDKISSSTLSAKKEATRKETSEDKKEIEMNGRRRSPDDKNPSLKSKEYIMFHQEKKNNKALPSPTLHDNISTSTLSAKKEVARNQPSRGKRENKKMNGRSRRHKSLTALLHESNHERASNYHTPLRNLDQISSDELNKLHEDEHKFWDKNRIRDLFSSSKAYTKFARRTGSSLKTYTKYLQQNDMTQSRLGEYNGTQREVNPHCYREKCGNLKLKTSFFQGGKNWITKPHRYKDGKIPSLTTSFLDETVFIEKSKSINRNTCVQPRLSKSVQKALSLEPVNRVSKKNFIFLYDMEEVKSTNSSLYTEKDPIEVIRDPHARQSKHMKKSSFKVYGDGDVWVEKILRGKMTKKKKSFFYSVKTGVRVPNEPPTGASKVVYVGDF